MKLIVPDWIGAPSNIGALSTERSGGVSGSPYDDGKGGGGLNVGVHVGDRAGDVLQNRAMLRKLLPAEPAWLAQIHGDVVVDAARVERLSEADACIASEPGVVCVIQTADCLPVLFCDTDGRVVGAAHAGWRGLAQGILENTISRMRAAGAADILAWLGPAIGPDRFEVGDDVLTAFLAKTPGADGAFKPLSGRPGKYLADIYQLARMAMRRAGVERIYGGEYCTVTSSERFYSYRRDRTTGRMASLIWIQPEHIG